MTSAGLNSLQEKMCSNSIWYFIILPKKTPFFKTKNKADFKCMDDWSPQWAQCPQQPQWPQQPHFTKKSLPPKWPITVPCGMYSGKKYFGVTHCYQYSLWKILKQYRYQFLKNTEVPVFSISISIYLFMTCLKLHYIIQGRHQDFNPTKAKIQNFNRSLKLFLINVAYKP